MLFQEKFNEVCNFPDCFEKFDDFEKAIETRIRNFNEEYEILKKNTDLKICIFRD